MYPFLYYNIRLPVLKRNKNFLGDWGAAHAAPLNTPMVRCIIKALSTLSQKSATVAENGECRRKRRENGDSSRIRRQSHFSATVAVFGDKLSPKSATIVASVDKL